MKLWNNVVARIKHEKSGGLVLMALLYAVTAVVAGVWFMPTPACQVSSPWSVLQCGVLAVAPWILVVMLLLMAAVLLVTGGRSDWYVVRRYVTVGGLIVYGVLVAGWVTAYSLL